MRINIKTTLGYLLLSLLITSCSSLPSLSSITSNQADPIKTVAMPTDRSGIAVCGGSLAPAVSANIESEYKKLATKVDDDFKQYVLTILTANNVNQEKYDAFMNCVLAVEEKEFTQFDLGQKTMACDDTRKQCVAENPDCVKQTKQTCFMDCEKNHRVSYDSCMDNCAFGLLDKPISKACVATVANCESAYTSCIDSIK